MPDFSGMLANNPNGFIYLFVGVLALFLVGFIMVKVMAAGKKKKMRAAGTMAELIFDERVRLAGQLVTDTQYQGYKLYSLNGGQPKIVDKSIFVPQGPCRIEIQYVDTDYATRRVSSTAVFEKQVLEFPVQSGQKYHIRFNEKTGAIEVQ